MKTWHESDIGIPITELAQRVSPDTVEHYLSLEAA